MLAVCVVHQHHGELQCAGGVHGLEALDAGSGFLAAAYHARNQLRELLVQGGNQVAAIVNNNVGAYLQHAADIGKIFLLRAAVHGEDVEALMYQRGGYVVLGAQGVGAGDVHICTAGRQHLAQVGRLGLQVNAQGHFEPLEGLRLFKILLDAVQQGHVAADPAQLELPAFPQGNIFDVVCHNSL